MLNRTLETILKKIDFEMSVPMLPTIRTQGTLYKIPQFDITVPDIKSFAKELKGFHSHFTQLCCLPWNRTRGHL